MSNINKNLKSAMAKLNKKFPNSVKFGNEIEAIEYLPTPSNDFNEMLGTPGLAKGKVVEFYGENSSGRKAVINF